jgi:hypothetical protein
VFARLETLCRSCPMAIAEAVSRQCLALASRGRYEAAVRLTLDCARALGIACPADGEWEQAVGAEIDALDAALRARGPELFDSLAPLADPEIETAAFMLVSSLSAAAHWQPMVSHWSKLRVVRIGYEQGSFAVLPEALVLIIISTVFLRDDYATGYRLAQAGAKLAGRYSSARLAGRVHFCLGTANGPWFEALERGIEHARQAYRWAVEAGDLECASFSYWCSLTGMIECASQLEEAAQEASTALQVAERTGDRSSRDSYMLQRRFVWRLSGEAPGPSDPDDYRTCRKATAHNPIAQLMLEIYQTLGDILFGAWDEALQHARSGAARVFYLTGAYSAALQRWGHARPCAPNWRRSSSGWSVAPSTRR